MSQTDFYVHLALSEDAVLDAGSGSDELLAALRSRGFGGRLVVLDGSPDGTQSGTPTAGDANVRRGPLPAAGVAREFALVIATGDVFSRLADESAVREFFVAAREALRPDGRLAFDAANPLVDHEGRFHAELLDHVLAEVGLAIHERYGDWDRSPFTPHSPRIITVVGPVGR
jgi:SAM-dependent methyltransferase